MRFLIRWEWTESTSDEEQAKALATFAAWTPPIELSEWSGFGDSNGGFAIAETDNPDDLARVTAPWTPWLRFSVRAIHPIDQTAAIMQEAIEFRRTVK